MYGLWAQEDDLYVTVKYLSSSVSFLPLSLPLSYIYACHLPGPVLEFLSC